MVARFHHAPRSSTGYRRFKSTPIVILRPGVLVLDNAVYLNWAMWISKPAVNESNKHSIELCWRMSERKNTLQNFDDVALKNEQKRAESSNPR